MHPQHPLLLNAKFHLLGGIAILTAAFLFSGCQNPGKDRKKTRSSKPSSASTTPSSARKGPLGRSTSYNRVSTGNPVLALTFDDGPHPVNTPRLLDILRSRNVKATFYVTGANARKNPDILRRMQGEGHEIGNHTMSHGRITGMSTSQVRQEIFMTQQAVRSATGMTPRSFRPPYGAISDSQKSWIKNEFGMPSILWSVDPEDWKKPGVRVVTSRLVNGARRGGILLLHDIHSPSVDATPGTIDELKRRGFGFVTISQLISMESGT